MATWPDRLPGRLEFECAQLRELGFVLDQGLLDRGGPVVFDGSIEHDGETVRLQLRCPDTFPYLRPEVLAPDLDWGRHQNPRHKNLCILERSTRWWTPADTCKWLITKQVPYLLDLLKGDPEKLREEEAPQGEPISVYFGHELGTAILVSDEFLRLPPEMEKGRGCIRFDRYEQAGPRIRGVVEEVSSWVKPPQRRGRKKNGQKPKDKRRTVALKDTALQERFAGGREVKFSWVRLSSAPTTFEAKPLFAELAVMAPTLREEDWNRFADGSEVAVIAALFPEEVRQGEHEDAWLFVLHLRGKGHAVTPGIRYTREDLAARIPKLGGLAEKTIAQAGLGGLGAPLALEFARAQVGELRVLDHELVEAGNTVRWPVGLPAVGYPKMTVIEASIKRDYPFTKVVPLNNMIGAAMANDDDEPEMLGLERFLAGADLLVDATAELGIQQLFADLADEAGIPQVYLWGTEGAVGGAVARVLPGRTGCWLCLQHYIEDGTVYPPLDPAGTTQPRGCGSPTFTGSSFDLLPIVAQAARTATDILTGRIDQGCDVAVLAFQDDQGNPLPVPQWTALDLTPHPKCPKCGGGAS